MTRKEMLPFEMQPREIESAKRIPSSRARALIIERGLSAIARLVLDQVLGLEAQDAAARSASLSDVQTLLDVLSP